MAKVPVPLYENPLKGAYPVPGGDKVLAITDTSCYTLAKETFWLTGKIPAGGSRSEYLDAMSNLGIAEPARIFDRLLAIGALRVKKKKSLGGLFRSFISPKIKLLSARVQEKLFCFFGAGPGELGKALRALAWPAGTGLAWGTLFLLVPGAVPPAATGGEPGGTAVIALVIAASLAHELGHSLAAAASGIGLRPIGFSVYLIYPVFYTNVSGMDRLKLQEKALIDCGGLILQSVFILALLLFLSLTGSPSAAAAARWITAIMLFNLNPLLRTDGYWLYKDVYSEFQHKGWMRYVHHVYLLVFVVFTAWFLWFVLARLSHVRSEFGELMRSPGYFLTGGYKVILGVYLVFVGLAGGLNRFKEGRREWKELRNREVPAS